MAELTVQERLQPSLLDRLTDDAPEKSVESREQRVLSLTQLRQSVLRDLGWLLNATGIVDPDLAERFPHVKRSVVNFGLPALAGTYGTGTDVQMLQTLLRDAVATFEPRILPETLEVRLVLDMGRHSHRALIFDIRGELWAQPVPIQVLLKTEVDLEIGTVKVTEGGRIR
jgi:type VI secretion system protein ImpF